MEQKSCHKLIYKLHSSQLRKSNWNLNLDLDTAIHSYPDIVVSLNDSQILRFIDELNGIKNLNENVADIQRQIRYEKKKPSSRETRITIRNLYNELYSIQFQKDYVCVIMDNNKDYDRANEGFIINGVEYQRFLGTNGGIKTSTIVYINKELYPELKKRLDNGRNKTIPLVPAKLEAYQALICSGSTPLPEPNGIIVVKDCITTFKEDIVLINDETDGEPIMTSEKDYEITHNDSDGYGLMLPSYSRKVNGYLTGDYSTEISGMNTRYAWTKGMVYTFDFLEFAEKVAGTFEVVDVWGAKRDIRNAEVILTESMLKLWYCYDSWEDYYQNCQENNYQFSTPKITPQKLENVRDTNYQFLQSYQFTDEEIYDLCKLTIDEINGILGMDYRKSLVFLAGFNLDELHNYNDNFDYSVKALMVEPKMINDPYIRKKIWYMIAKRIDMAKRGAVRVYANFAMIAGDPYSLCQNIFGLEVTGLLKAGEIYHKYWIDKGSDELVCFRAPMTCHNNIRKMKLSKSESTAYWYRYIKTALIYNAWDTACDAMNGADKDGDTNMCTDNPILLKRTLNSPTIICVQRKAKDKVVEESDIIEANKLAFNDDIGIITNHVTSMIERQAGFEKDTEEYDALSYRIMCGQLYQQNAIDRAKGIIAKPMPKYWYSARDNLVKEEDSEEVQAQKNFNLKIVAAKKPYFMTYVYPSLRTENNLYLNNNSYGAVMRFQNYGVRSIDDLYQIENPPQEVQEYLEYFERNKPTGNNSCVVNRICWLAEKEFANFTQQKEKLDFDYMILKSNVGYSKATYRKIIDLYKEYKERVELYQQKFRTEKIEKDAYWMKKQMFVETFKADCEKVCPNEDELCDIVIDICYHSENSKQFAWDICGETMIRNLIAQSDGTIHYPHRVKENGEFEYCGEQFEMCSINIMESQHDNTE